MGDAEGAEGEDEEEYDDEERDGRDYPKHQGHSDTVKVVTLVAADSPGDIVHKPSPIPQEYKGPQQYPNKGSIHHKVHDLDKGVLSQQLTQSLKQFLAAAL